VKQLFLLASLSFVKQLTIGGGYKRVVVQDLKRASV